MINCIICGEKTEHPSHDYCSRCFTSAIEELEERYKKRETSGIGEDQVEVSVERRKRNGSEKIKRDVWSAV